MKTAISEQQAAFYTKNGFIEFEIAPPPIPRRVGYDLWREDAAVEKWLVKTLPPVAFALTGKKQLRLGCDRWFYANELPEKAGTLKEVLSLQRLALGVAVAENPQEPGKRFPLGLLPVPQAGHVLFFRPDLILDWPHVKTDIYLAIYTLPNAVYVHNAKDPFTNSLKRFGYHFGDVLKSERHPLLVQ